MGFLDNLLKKETRKIISGVVDSVVDNVMNDVKGSLQNGSQNGSQAVSAKVVSPNKVSINTTASSRAVKPRENETGDDADCDYNIETIRHRIELVVAQDWPGYELRRNISAETFGGSKYDHAFDYGLYLDGQPKLMIMILEQYQHRNKSVQNAHAACERQGVASFHLLRHLPNRKTYIEEKMKALMPQ